MTEPIKSFNFTQKGISFLQLINSQFPVYMFIDYAVTVSVALKHVTFNKEKNLFTSIFCIFSFRKINQRQKILSIADYLL